MGQPSENKEARRKLIELNDELENYFRNTIIPQLFVDADLRLRKFTPPAMTHFNLTAGDLGRHIDEVSSNIRFPTIIENIREVIGRRENLEKDIQTTDRRWYQMNILPYLVQKENRANGVIITFVDIHERIAVLAGYERLNKRYEGIIYSISHDVLGPLGIMGSLVDLLREEPGEEEERRQVLGMLGQAVGNLRNAVAELTDIRESDTDFAREPERVNFGNVLEYAQLALKDKIHETGARVRAELDEAEVRLPRKNLRSILYNLLSNALKYGAPGRVPEITIRTARSGEYTLLSVSDNGRGIAEGQQEAIFERHTRLGGDEEGRGLGLFIVQRMAEDAGGRVEVESTLGVGTTFRVYFKNPSP